MLKLDRIEIRPLTIQAHISDETGVIVSVKCYPPEARHSDIVNDLAVDGVKVTRDEGDLRCEKCFNNQVCSFAFNPGNTDKCIADPTIDDLSKRAAEMMVQVTEMLIQATNLSLSKKKREMAEKMQQKSNISLSISQSHKEIVGFLSERDDLEQDLVSLKRAVDHLSAEKMEDTDV